ncbi:hypothetical protein J4232_05040 [Candidatus Woesearchaeota archaeon]|nr:hypothetical protein [Candidatus Woesearchaeota archaeon]
MPTQITLDENKYNEMEKHLLDQIMEVSKSMLETFKFGLIYGTKVTSEQSQKTIKSIQEFRSKNWDSSVNRKEAYKKYVNLYN